jgi:hypothetical protein
LRAVAVILGDGGELHEETVAWVKKTLGKNWPGNQVHHNDGRELDLFCTSGQVEKSSIQGVGFCEVGEEKSQMQVALENGMLAASSS